MPATPLCDRWEWCQQRDEELGAQVKAISERQHEEYKELTNTITDLRKAIQAMGLAMAELKGKVAGYVMVGTIFGGVISFIAARVFKA